MTLPIGCNPDTDRLVNAHLWLVWKHVKRYAPMLRNPSYRDDMTSDAMLALVKAAQRYDAAGEKFVFWAERFVKGACLDRLRVANGSRRVTKVETVELKYSPPVNDRGLELVDVKDAAGRIVRRIKSLQSQVLVLHHRRGMARKDIATFLGVSEGRVSQLIHEAYARIRNPDLMAVRNKRVMKIVRRCAKPGCNGDYYARGYCESHWKRATYVRKERPVYRCGVSGCDRKYHGGGLCKHHYTQRRRGILNLSVAA